MFGSKDIKEEVDQTLSFVSANGDPTSLSLVEKYLQYDSDGDSDGDYLPDTTTLKEEYNRLRNDTNLSYKTRLSTGLSKSNSGTKSGLNELIEKLDSVRRCGTDGNSIFCTEAELENIQEKYEDILDFIRDKSTTFEKKDLTDQQEDEQNREQTDNNNISAQSEDLKILLEKMELVGQARDKFYEVEQQVREQLDQLELVERYKMESVG